MAVYAGETLRIRTSAKGLDENTLTDLDVLAVKVSIFGGDGTQVLAESTMTYDPDRIGWFYDWATEGLDPGGYQAKVRYLGSTYDSWEFIRITLRANPV